MHAHGHSKVNAINLPTESTRKLNTEIRKNRKHSNDYNEQSVQKMLVLRIYKKNIHVFSQQINFMSALSKDVYVCTVPGFLKESCGQFLGYDMPLAIYSSFSSESPGLDLDMTSALYLVDFERHSPRRGHDCTITSFLQLHLQLGIFFLKAKVSPWYSRNIFLL